MKNLQWLLCIALLLLLNACGSGCYPDVNLDEGGNTYTNQTRTFTIAASEQNWTDTQIKITKVSYPIEVVTLGTVQMCATPPEKKTPMLANSNTWKKLNTSTTTVFEDDLLEISIPSAIPYPTKPLGDPISYPYEGKLKHGTADMNRWSYRQYIPEETDVSEEKAKEVEKNCPKSIIFQFDPADPKYKQCSFLNQGYYTCPLLAVKSGHFEESFSDNPYSPQPFPNCWFVAGAGLQIKFVHTGDCTAPGKIIMFNDETIEDYGTLTYVPTYNGENPLKGKDISKLTKEELENLTKTIDPKKIQLTGPGCPAALASASDLDNVKHCTNRLTKRKIQTKHSYDSICARFVDVNPDDNAGGYTPTMTQTPCRATDGKRTPAHSETPNLGALVYTIGGNPGKIVPSSKQITTSGTDTATGNLSIKIENAAGIYGKGVGNYEVTIKYKEAVAAQGLGCAIEFMKNMLRHITLDALPSYFSKLACVGDSCKCSGINCDSFSRYIRVLLILYIMFYGLGFLIGYTEISQMDLVVRFVKIGVVLALISPNSWNFFHDYFFDLFICGMDDLIRKSQLHGTPDGNVFGFVDHTLEIMLFNKNTFLKLLALCVINPMGTILAIMVLIGIILFLIGVFNALVVYLMAILIIGFLFALAPIFIPFILFQPTRHLFDNWITKLVQYSLEPVLLLIGLSLLVELLHNVFIQIVNFSVCWKCMWPISLHFGAVWDKITSALSSSDSFFCLPFFGPWGMLVGGGGASFSSLGVEVINVLLFLILAKLIQGYDAFTQSMISSIVGSKKQSFKGPDGQKTDQISSVGQAMLQRTGITGAQAKIESAVGTRIRRTLGIMRKAEKKAEADALKRDEEELKQEALQNASSAPGGGAHPPAPGGGSTHPPAPGSGGAHPPGTPPASGGPLPPAPGSGAHPPASGSAPLSPASGGPLPPASGGLPPAPGAHHPPVPGGPPPSASRSGVGGTPSSSDGAN